MFRPVCAIRLHTAFAILAAALTLTLALPGIARAETTFTITGHGYGHGIGMSQYGARSLATRGWSYTSILGHYYQGTSLGSLGYTTGSTSETVMRVALERTDTAKDYWTVRSNVGELWVAWEGMPAGGYLKFPAGTSYTFLRTGGAILMRNQSAVPVMTFPADCDWVQVWERDASDPHGAGLTQVLSASGPFSWTNVLYPGSLRIEKQSTTLTGMYLRNHVYMEDYIRCVVPRESPASWPLESLKAQSVAARSYAYVSRKPTNTYDVYCTTASQVYNGWGTWVSSTGNTRHLGDSGVDPAVDATPAQVVKSGSTIVQTYFFSTSGGYTEDISNVWPSATQQPYYTAVPDPFEHESGSTKHDWGPFVYTATQVRSLLASAGVSLTKLPDPIIDMQVTKRGASGRVMELQLIGVGQTSILSGSTEIGYVRKALCNSLDTWFYVDAVTDRVEGDTRYDTAVEISKASFPSSANVVVANGTSFADALTAAGLAGALDAPVLLVEQTRVSDAVIAEIERLGATRVYVIGGSGVVGDGAIADLEAITAVGSQGIDRVAGADRYETGLRVAERIKAIKGAAYSRTAIVVSGVSFPDAVAAAPWAYRADTAIILVKPTGAPPASIQAVQTLGAISVQVVGGQGVVPDATADDFGVTVKRVADGVDRYETAALLADYLVAAGGFRWNAVHVASGESLVDALAGGSYAARNSGPVLFATRYTLPEASAQRLAAHKIAIQQVSMFGGHGVLNNVVEARIEEGRD
ncbi:MAG: cell wall-binding repeat-containing protein [Coriobacteriia bacterium]|nr:cell wall-binding repeat-containing protein [Coriobacteriia bacterium]